MRILFLGVISFFLLTGCLEKEIKFLKPTEKIGENAGQTKFFKPNIHNEKRIYKTALKVINNIRGFYELQPVSYNESLNKAAQEHARDVMLQSRAWHFGNDGSSPINRTERAGYEFILIGETISESYEDVENTIIAWIKEENTRVILLAPEASHLGLGYVQEAFGKIWWVLMVGGPGNAQPVSVVPEFSSLKAYLEKEALKEAEAEMEAEMEADPAEQSAVE